MKLFLILFSSLMMVSCILNVFGPSDQMDHKDGALLDTQKNRRLMIDSYEGALMQEYKGVAAPPACKNWDEFWGKRFRALKDGKSENPDFYIQYIKQRRNELRLPRS